MNENECAICLGEFKRVSSIVCDHKFCFECIHAWSQNTNSCPLCKKEFKFITATNPQAKIMVKRKKQIAEYDSEEIERLNVSSDAEPGEEDELLSGSEYDFDGFVVPDHESSNGTSSDGESEISFSDGSADTRQFRSSLPSLAEEDVSESSIEVLPRRKRLRKKEESDE
jgi:hypothetical protein